jgi:hypothetical protein
MAQKSTSKTQGTTVRKSEQEEDQRNERRSEAGEVSPERRSAVEVARQSWIQKLIDLSRRNNLLYFKDLKAGTLDLSETMPEFMDEFMAGNTLSLTQLLLEVSVEGFDDEELTLFPMPLGSQQEEKALRAAREMQRRARANREEKGLETLLLAVGMATWPAPDGGRPPEAPVLLIPVSIQSRGRSLRRAGEVQINLVLLHVLEEEHGCRLDQETLLEGVEGIDEEARGFVPETVFSRLREATSHIRGFDIRRRFVLGNFAFQKMAMVKDLRTYVEELVQNDLIAAIAGDRQSRDHIASTNTNPDPRELDTKPPESEFLVLDADSSQQLSINQVLAGQSGVVHGPPGTGKSQTIANLIAALAAHGKRALFVAEKRAALEVVLQRLKDIGLGHLALDVHGADISRKAVMQHVDRALTHIHNSLPVEAEAVHKRFAERRQRLNDHVRRLHLKRPPSGMSAFELQGRLLCTPPEARTTIRWRGSDLDRLDAAAADTIQDLVAEAGGFAALFRKEDPSPWTRAHVPDGHAVQSAMDVATRCAEERWPAFQAALEWATGAADLNRPKTIAESQEFATLLSNVARTIESYSEAIYCEDLDELALALEPASRGLLIGIWAFLTSAGYRSARSKLRSLRQAGPARARKLHAEVSEALEQRNLWQRWSTAEAMPRIPEGHEQLGDALDSFLHELDILIRYLPELISKGGFGCSTDPI